MLVIIYIDIGVDSRYDRWTMFSPSPPPPPSPQIFFWGIAYMISYDMISRFNFFFFFLLLLVLHGAGSVIVCAVRAAKGHRYKRMARMLQKQRPHATPRNHAEKRRGCACFAWSYSYFPLHFFFSLSINIVFSLDCDTGLM